MGMKIRVLVILHSYMIFEHYDLKHFYAIFVHSYMILNASIRSRAKQKQNIPVTPIFNHLFWLTMGITRMFCFGLSSLSRFYTISNTLIRSWILWILFSWTWTFFSHSFNKLFMINNYSLPKVFYEDLYKAFIFHVEHPRKGGFPLGEMTSDFAAKSRRNYFAAKLYMIFTWITLTRLLKTLWKIRLLLLKMLNQTMIKLRIKINELSSF